MYRLLPNENISHLQRELDQEDGLPQVSYFQAMSQEHFAPRQAYIKILTVVIPKCYINIFKIYNFT